MNFVPLVDRLPPFLQNMLDRAMERPINFDERPAQRRRINPVYLAPVAPRTPRKSDTRKVYDD